MRLLLLLKLLSLAVILTFKDQDVYDMKGEEWHEDTGSCDDDNEEEFLLIWKT